MKSTQTTQMNALVAFMEIHPDLAKNYMPNSQARAKSKNLWTNITAKLNSLGPPEKTVDGWKNVWKDFKYNIKRKMRDNKLHSSGTGGGPNKQKTFSENEKAVIAILDLKEAVAGNTLGMHFGNPSRLLEEQVSYEIVDVPMEDFENAEEINNDSVNFVEPLNIENVENTNKIRKSKKSNRTDLLQKHVEMQADVLELLNKKLSSVECTQREILKEIKEMNKWHKESDRWKRKMFNLKKEKLEEQKSYNKNKTRARLELIAIKSKKLELEEMKMGCQL